MNRKPAIISLKKYVLTSQEKYILKTEKPWGVILFKRNIKSYDQVRNLTQNIRQCIKDPFYPIFIDEEGGIVSRLSHFFLLRSLSNSINPFLRSIPPK